MTCTAVFSTRTSGRWRNGTTPRWNSDSTIADCRFDELFLVCRYRVRPEQPDKCEESVREGRRLREGLPTSS